MYSNDQALHQEIQEHLVKVKTLVIATRDAKSHDPDASYAPYVEHEGRFYILISTLAAHTRNLLAYDRCHVLFIADEQNSPNLFARKRVSFRCTSEAIDRSQSHGVKVIALLRDRLGPVVDMLASLGDFHLIQLTPESGTYVKGFGQAFPFQVSFDNPG
jgi:heme iron utilization protein